MQIEKAETTDFELLELGISPFKENEVIFEIVGDSMEDGTSKSICKSDIVTGQKVNRELWSNELNINRWNFIIVQSNGINCVRRITNHDLKTGIIKCHALNSRYDDFEINLRDVTELYELIRMTITLADRNN